MSRVEKSEYDADDKDYAQGSPDNRTNAECSGSVLRVCKLCVVACIITLTRLFASEGGGSCSVLIVAHNEGECEKKTP